jgi:sortase (surface protein transpeptidase)
MTAEFYDKDIQYLMTEMGRISPFVVTVLQFSTGKPCRTSMACDDLITVTKHWL